MDIGLSIWYTFFSIIVSAESLISGCNSFRLFVQAVMLSTSHSLIRDSIHQKLAGTAEGKKKIAEMKSDVKQKEQSQERISIKEKLEANK